MYLAKVISSTVVAIKVKLFGRAREKAQVLPYGIDSRPVAGLVALYIETGSLGEEKIVGFVNKELLTSVGESRLYSTDASGAFKFNIWTRADGTCLIGDSSSPAAYTNNPVKWTEFNSLLQAYFTTLNAAITAGVISAGGTYTPPTAPNFTTAKATKIKIN